jgi:hypothetical protein
VKKVREIFARSFGGLPRDVYIRSFVFGLPVPLIMILVLTTGSLHGIKLLKAYAMIGCLALHYPYAKYVRDQVLGFIQGDDTYYVNLVTLYVFRYLVYGLVFAFTWILAPLGLLILYFRSGK